MSEREIVREVNALTVMPLPVKIPVSWYEALPKVLPLLRWSTEHPRFFMAEEIIDIFLTKWRKILIRQEADFVWLHLGGVACYEVIPNFIKGVRDKIDSSDSEIGAQGGTPAIIHHWRTHVEGLKDLEDQAVLKARDSIMQMLDSELWNAELGKSWSFAAERAHVNFGKIRPVIKKWIAKYEGRCNLDEPFGGRLSAGRYPASDGGVL